jgi:putative ABC transport system substrate-binding protein
MTLLGGAAALPACFPRSPSAQPARIPRLGVLLYSTAQADPNVASFRRGMRDLGYIDRQNIAIEYRAAEGRPERLPELAADLVRGAPDVLFALGGDVMRGGDVIQVAAKATRSIPIVFVSSADPVQLGFVASLARPGGNATGVTLLMDELASKRLELLREAAPNTSRVAFLWNPDHIDNELREAERASSSLGVTLLRLALHDPDDLDAILRVARDGRADALYVVSSRQTVRGLDKVVAFADRYRLPLAGGWGAWAQAGGLLSYGPNVDDMVRRATTYVDRILKGSRPADLPVQQPTKFELVINLKTAKALGLTVAESFLLRADRVIE